MNSDTVATGTPGANTPGANTPGADTPGADTPGASTPAGGAAVAGTRDRDGTADHWAGYAADIRTLWLAGVRARDRYARTAAAAATTGAGLDHLAARLAVQRRQLIELAARLRLPRPRIEPREPQVTGAAGGTAGFPRGPGYGDGGHPAAALQYAIEACDRADAAARAAVWRGQHAALLPGLAPTGRAAAIFGGWALAGWLLQFASLLVVPQAAFTAQVFSLCALPILAFAGGYLTLLTAGRPRLCERPAAPPVVLGLVICLVAMPLAWLLLIAGRGLL